MQSQKPLRVPPPLSAKQPRKQQPPGSEEIAALSLIARSGHPMVDLRVTAVRGSRRPR
jgi:hypothetical protein